MQIPQHTPLLKQVTDILRCQVQAGAFREVLPAERVLADSLHVSRPTVRAALKILRHEGLVQIAQGKPTRVVRRHRAGGSKARVMTLLTPESLKAITGADLLVINELRQHLHDAGYQLELHSDVRLRVADPRAILEKLLLQAAGRVWILHLLSPAVHRFFAERGLKALVLGSTSADSGLPAFGLDFRAVCRHAAGQFLRRGHRRVGLVTPAADLAGDTEGKAGFLEAFEGVAHADARPTIITHAQTAETLCTALDRAMTATTPPTGLLVSHPHGVLTLLTHLLKSGIRVPGDLSLISRGYAEYLDHVVPRLACYRIDWTSYARRFSRAAVQLLQTGDLSAKSTLFEPDFTSGGSLADAPRLPH